jgi:hypothetical protein
VESLHFLLILFGPALASGGAVAVATRLLLLRPSATRRQTNKAAAIAGSAAAATWLVFSFDWFAYHLDETRPLYYPFSPYAEYRRSLQGDSAFSIGIGYSLLAGCLVAAAACLYERAHPATWTIAALIAAGSVTLPAVVPAALPRTEYAKDPVYYVSQPAYEDINSGRVGVCVAYGVDRGAPAGLMSDDDKELCFEFEPTPQARRLVKGDASVLIDELNESRVRPYDRVEDLDAEGLEIVRSAWRDVPRSLAGPPVASEPPAETRIIGDSETKSNTLRVASHLRACRPAYDAYQPCAEPAKLRAVSVPIGAGPSQVEVSGLTTDDFVVTGHSALSHHFMVSTSDGRRQPRFCHPRGRGGCPASGRW